MKAHSKKKKRRLRKGCKENQGQSFNQKFQYICKASKKNAEKKIKNPIVAGLLYSSKDKVSGTDSDTDAHTVDSDTD